MKKDRQKPRPESHSSIMQTLGRIGDLLGVLFLLGPGLMLILLDFLPPSSPPENPTTRAIVPSSLLMGLGIVLLIYGGLALCYVIAGWDD